MAYPFDNAGRSTATETVSLNGIYPSGNYYIHISLIDEGDQYNRLFYVYLNGQQIYSTTVGPYCTDCLGNYIQLGPYNFNSQQTYTLGIQLTTYNYASQGDWWIVNATINNVNNVLNTPVGATPTASLNGTA
jgi:hypothetical protein